MAFFGLEYIETGRWSGLPLTLLLSLFGMVAAYPLGILLALGRQSKMPAIKSLCVVYIELIRGVPPDQFVVHVIGDVSSFPA